MQCSEKRTTYILLLLLLLMRARPNGARKSLFKGACTSSQCSWFVINFHIYFKCAVGMLLTRGEVSEIQWSSRVGIRYFLVWQNIKQNKRALPWLRCECQDGGDGKSNGAAVATLKSYLNGGYESREGIRRYDVAERRPRHNGRERTFNIKCDRIPAKKIGNFWKIL